MQHNHLQDRIDICPWDPNSLVNELRNSDSNFLGWYS